MPAPAHAARIAAIGDLAAPLAALVAAVPSPSEARAPLLGFLGHLRRLYAAEVHALLRSALDIYLDGHPLPDARGPRHHIACARAELAHLRRVAPAESDALSAALAPIWASVPRSRPGAVWASMREHYRATGEDLVADTPAPAEPRMVLYRPALESGHDGQLWVDDTAVDVAHALASGAPWSPAAVHHALALAGKGARP